LAKKITAPIVMVMPDRPLRPTGGKAWFHRRAKCADHPYGDFSDLVF
jgi:hypothetical protein